mgnify:CR=1 FL=1
MLFNIYHTTFCLQNELRLKVIGMEIKLLAQITLDGYIARPDGKRDWYLNPDIYGITAFFDHASAILDYDDGKYKVEMRNGYVFFDNELEGALSRLKDISGYLAIEATHSSLPLIQILLAHHYIKEIHYIQIPVRLKQGYFLFTFHKLRSAWQQADMRPIDKSGNISYSILRHDHF